MSEANRTKPAAAGPAFQSEGQSSDWLEPERASSCGLTECASKPECARCRCFRERDAGWPASADERYLRRLLARAVAMPHTCYDDGEAQGQELGVSIDFLREPVAAIDAKLRALSIARYESSNTLNAKPAARAGGPAPRTPEALGK